MKENFIKSWFIANGLLIVLGGAGAYFLLQQLGESEENYNTCVSNTQNFTSGAIYPNEDNLDEKEELVKALEKDVKVLSEDFASYQGLGEETPENFNAFFSNQVRNLKRDLRKAKVEFVPDTLFGFEDYATQSVKEEDKEDICFSVKALFSLLAKAADSKVSTIDNVYREKFELGETKKLTSSEKAKLKKSLVKKEYLFEIVVSGSESSIRSFLNKIQHSKDYLTSVRSLRLQSANLKPLVIQEGAKSKSASSLAASILGQDAEVESEEAEINIDKVSGDSDLYMAIQVKFVRG